MRLASSSSPSRSHQEPLGPFQGDKQRLVPQPNIANITTRCERVRTGHKVYTYATEERPTRLAA